MRGKNKRVCIDVGKYGPVDADGGVGAGVIDIAGIDVIGKLMPVPEREARVAAFYSAVEVIPMIQYPDLRSR